MASMFNGASVFNGDIGDWDVSNVTNMIHMFAGTAITRANYDAILMGWSTIDPGENTLQKGVELSADGLEYCAVKARGVLTGPPNNWRIFFDKEATDCPVPTLSIADVTVDEDVAGGLAELTVTLSVASGQDVTVTYTTSTGGTDDTAMAGVDYETTTGTLTIPAGQTSGTINVPIMDDTAYEGDESFTVALSNPGNAGLDPDPAVATVTITDNDLPTLSIADVTVGEGDGTASLTVTLSAPSTETVTVDWNTEAQGDTATAGSDYTTITDPLSFAPGDTEKTITVTILEDVAYEGDESFTVALSNPGNAGLDPDPAVATVTITDNDLPTLSIADVTVGEGDGTASLTVTLSAPSTETVTVDWNTEAQGDTATAGSDYTTITDPLSFAPGDTEKTITVTILEDVAYEGDESFTVALSNPGNAGLDPDPAVATVTITDNDAPEAAAEFVTTWRTTEANERITIPTITSNGEVYDYAVNWGDGSIDAGWTGDATHTYATADDHEVRISGDFPRIYFDDSNLPGKIVSIEQWGDIAWTSMERAFFGATNLAKYTATDAPNLSGVTNMSQMFHAAVKFDGNIGGWDVSNVTDMAFMFFNAKTFNQDIGGWNVSSVTNMNSMFDFASDFDQNIGDWNVSSVTIMGSMLRDTDITRANYDAILTGWSTIDEGEGEGALKSGVFLSADDLEYCAVKARGVLTGPPNNWRIFNDKEATDCPVPTLSIADITVDESDTTASLTVTLSEASGQDVTVTYTTSTGGTDGTAVAGSDYTAPPAGTGTLTIPAGQTNGTINVTIVDDNVYEGDESFTVALSNPGNAVLDPDPATATVTITDNDAPEADEEFVTTWKTTGAGESITIPTTGGGYNYAVNWGDGSIDAELTGNVSHTYATQGEHVVRISGVFPRIYFKGSGEEEKIYSIDQWGTIAWTSMEDAFRGASNLEKYNATDAPVLTNVTDMSGMFAGASKFDGDIGDWDVSSVTDMNSMFSGASKFDGIIGGWDVSSVTDMSDMFSAALAFNQDLGWDVSKVTDMSGMFFRATTFDKNIGAWDVSEVTNMGNMFTGASKFDGNIGDWDVSSVTDMGNMFFLATEFDQNIGGWDVSKVTDMRNMFQQAPAFNQDIGWNVSSVTNMEAMFANATDFNGQIGAWADKVSSVTSMGFMFNSATAFNQDIGAWNVSSVTRMAGMFRRATDFDQNIGGWNVSSVTTMEGMFTDAGITRDTYDAILTGWSTIDEGEGALKSGVFLSADDLEYCAVKARGVLTGPPNNWRIFNDKEATDCPVPTLSIADITVDESDTTASLTVTLSEASGQDVTVTYTTSTGGTDGTAVAGSDYTAPPAGTGTLTIPAGQTSGTINVPVVDDTAYEGDESFTVALSKPGQCRA